MNKENNEKYSIGLSLKISIDQYNYIFDKYNNYIKSIYYSPPLGNKYHSRSSIGKQLENEQNVEKLYKILELAKIKGILCDCVLNCPSLKNDDIVVALEFLKSNIYIDQITCLQQHIDVVDKYFPHIEKIYSFNNNLNINNLEHISKKFKTIVAGKSFLRYPELLSKIYNYGFDLKLLVNNGCSFNCYGCSSGSRKCEQVFYKNLENFDINYLYALQSFYPSELRKLLDTVNFPIESIKISNRTDDYNYLINCLNSYINNDESYCLKDKKDYRLWCRLGHFNDYLNCLDDEKIKLLKKEMS